MKEIWAGWDPVDLTGQRKTLHSRRSKDGIQASVGRVQIIAMLKELQSDAPAHLHRA